MCFLNPSASVLWDMHASGLDRDVIADVLVECHGLDHCTATNQIDMLMTQWGSAGLLEQVQTTAGPASESVDTTGQDPQLLGACTANVVRVCLTAPDLFVNFCCDDASLFKCIASLLGPAVPGNSQRKPVRHLYLRGSPVCWQLWLDGVEAEQGGDRDSAIATTIGALIGIGAMGHKSLAVIHGAALELPTGGGLLLVARGGSGKSTLATALNARGLRMLHDDVIPVNSDGALLGIAAPICLKVGSWPVLESYRPDLSDAPVLQRMGKQVCYLAALGGAVDRPLLPELLLFPKYDPASIARLDLLTPDQVLQGLIETNTYIPPLTHQSFASLARWVSAVPAYALSYPDLSSAIDWVGRLTSQPKLGATGVA